MLLYLFRRLELKEPRQKITSTNRNYRGTRVSTYMPIFYMTHTNCRTRHARDLVISVEGHRLTHQISRGEIRQEEITKIVNL